MALARMPGLTDINVGSHQAKSLHDRIDNLREAMDSEMRDVRDRSVEYLRWYSPPWNQDILRHDSWDDEISADDIGLTRGNFPIARACVDIWTSLEAANAPTNRAEPERIAPPPPTADEQEAMKMREMFAVFKSNEAAKTDMRSWVMRNFRRRDQFTLKNFRATRRKNLYGFSWVKVIPHAYEDRPMSHPVRNPTAVFPLWSTREPDDIEAILVVYQENAVLANERYELGLDVTDGRVRQWTDMRDSQVDPTRWVDPTSTMLWLEEYWWIEREYKNGRVVKSCVYMARRCADRIVEYEKYEGWRYVPFVPFQNSDERDSYGWSDIAGVIDINDEINRRMSQEGDIIGMYSSPRFQLLGGVYGQQRDMPGPFEMISLSDQERIEQIMTRIDLFPSQVHFNTLIDLLHRVSGLPPIVWGLIANAQTSGRALTASWKATETRLAPKLMTNEASLVRWDEIILNYIQVYDWLGARKLFHDRQGKPFTDFRWTFPPMEPRDFQEVTMNAITKRDAQLITTEMAMREVGDEAAEDTIVEVKAEALDAVLHPDKRQAFELLKSAELQNAQMAMQLQQPAGPQAASAAPGPVPQNVPQAVGAAGAAAPPPGAVPGPEQGGPPMPPTQAGANGNVGPPAPGGPPGGPQVSTGTLMRNGDVSNQFLATGRLQP
jgi:hypothetical protein